MNMKRKERKGTTLAELCVVLALVTIIGAMVVSFSVMFSQRISLSAARLEVMGDLEAVDNITEAWLGQMKILGAELSLQTDEDDGQTWLQARVGTEENSAEYTLIFDEETHVLTGALPGEEVISFASAEVQWMQFSVVEKVGQTDRLFFCTLICNLPGMGGGKENQYQQTFCINPRVGDTYVSALGADTATDTETGSEVTDEGGGAE